MAKHITELNISSFRGIKNLELNNLSDINIIVGDNNSGKTSLLEAIQIFCDPTESVLVSLSRQREGIFINNRTPVSDSLMYLFDFTKKEENHCINLSGRYVNEWIDINIVGQVEQEIISADDIDERMFKKNVYEELQAEEIDTFIGAISRNGIMEKIRLNSFTSARRRKDYSKLIPLEMILPFDSTASNSIREITRSKVMIKEAVKLLQKFDSRITDIRYKDFESKFTRSRPLPVIEINESILVPLSTYGDGMKKCLIMLNKLLSAKNGVLLIDEFETALHTNLMHEVFSFLITVAQELNIQLFMTTHSLEAVDKLLESSKSHLDNVRVIRLANREDKTYAGIINGNKAYELRNTYGTELRA